MDENITDLQDDNVVLKRQYQSASIMSASTVEILKGAQEENHTENYNSAQEEHATATGDQKIIKPE